MLNDRCQLGVWTSDTPEDLKAAKSHLTTGFSNMERAFNVRFSLPKWSTSEIHENAGFPPHSVALHGTVNVLGKDI